MKPVDFKEKNVVLGEGQDHVIPLPAHRDAEGNVVSCWTLSEEEKARVAETGQVWLNVATYNRPLQPVFVTGLKEEVLVPIVEPKAEEEE